MVRWFGAVVCLVLLHVSTEDTPPCNFAQNYDVNELIRDASLQSKFINDAAYWEGRFAVHGIGLNVYSGLTYDGNHFDHATGEIAPNTAHTFSAASKESVHVALLALAVDGNSAARTFMQSSLDAMKSMNISNDLDSFVIDQLKQKIDSYESFNQRYPAFGGWLPWYNNTDGGMELQWDWRNRTPSLDNGENVWSLVAAVQVLLEKNHTELANRYQKHVDLMASTGLKIFLVQDALNTTGLSCVASFENVTKAPADQDYYPDGCFLDDPYEGETTTFFLQLFADWSQYGGNQTVDQIWINKRQKLQKTYLNTSAGPIDVEKGWAYSSHEKWKFMQLPYFDVDVMNRVYLNGERARVYNSYDKKYAGLFGAATNVSQPGSQDQYNPNYIGKIGIDEIAFEKTEYRDLMTPYGAYPLLVHPDIRPYGLAWYANMLQGDRMQGPHGSSESINLAGDMISPTLTWDTKVTNVLAFSGGVGSIVRRYLRSKPGAYETFMSYVKQEWELVFGTDALQGSKLPFVGPAVSFSKRGQQFFDNKCSNAGTTFEITSVFLACSIAWLCV